MNYLTEILTLKLTCLIMQQKQTNVDTSSFVSKSNLATLKTEVDKLDINKLVPVPVDLSKLSDVVKNDVVKKTALDKLVAKKIVLILADYTGKKELENKFLILVVLIKK